MEIALIIMAAASISATIYSHVTYNRNINAKIKGVERKTEMAEKITRKINRVKDIENHAWDLILQGRGKEALEYVAIVEDELKEVAKLYHEMKNSPDHI